MVNQDHCCSARGPELRHAGPVASYLCSRVAIAAGTDHKSQRKVSLRGRSERISDPRIQHPAVRRSIAGAGIAVQSFEPADRAYHGCRRQLSLYRRRPSGVWFYRRRQRRSDAHPGIAGHRAAAFHKPGKRSDVGERTPRSTRAFSLRSRFHQSGDVRLHRGG